MAARQSGNWRAVAKSADVKHFIHGTPPARQPKELARSGKKLEKKGQVWCFGSLLARGGSLGEIRNSKLESEGKPLARFLDKCLRSRPPCQKREQKSKPLVPAGGVTVIEAELPRQGVRKPEFGNEGAENRGKSASMAFVCSCFFDFIFCANQLVASGAVRE